jgi:hypothetical protein
MEAEMMGITRGFSTLVGVAVAGFLIWLAAQMGTGGAGEYWATYGLVAAAGLTMALSQILGGWTKWGWPRLSAGVFLLGFLPALVVGGWVLLARQPADFFNTSNWSRDLGVDGVVSDLGELLAAVAFGIGLTFGLTFDTSGPRREVVETVERDRIGDETTTQPPATVRDRAAADEPLTAERAEEADRGTPTEADRGRRFGLRGRVPAGQEDPRIER